MGMDPSNIEYYTNLKTTCPDKIEYNVPLNNLTYSSKKAACEWSKEKKDTGCFVPWDGITNGFTENSRQYC